MRPTIRSLVAVLALAPLATAAGQGKGRIELTPFLGMYLPVADLITESDPGSGLSVVFGQKSAFSLGARLGYGLSDRAALEGKRQAVHDPVIAVGDMEIAHLEKPNDWRHGGIIRLPGRY